MAVTQVDTQELPKVLINPWVHIWCRRLVYFNKSFIPRRTLIKGVFATQICNSYTVGLPWQVCVMLTVSILVSWSVKPTLSWSFSNPFSCPRGNSEQLPCSTSSSCPLSSTSTPCPWASASSTQSCSASLLCSEVSQWLKWSSQHFQISL